MMTTKTHDRKTHDLPTRMLSTAQACEAEASEWLEAFGSIDHEQLTRDADATVTHLRVLASTYRLNRQLYIDGAPIDFDDTSARALRQTARQLELYENDRLAIVAALMEPSA